jgi:hypothetical protein
MSKTDYDKPKVKKYNHIIILYNVKAEKLM